MTAPYRVDTLGAEHDRQAFDCGVEPLNRYLKETARQDERKLVSRCFVACPAESMAIAGSYTLSSAELPTNALPETISRKLPRYPSTPVGRMGRLAVDRRYRGQGLGSALVANAIIRALTSDLAAFALVVDAKDEATADFYEHAGLFVLDRGGSRARAAARKPPVQTRTIIVDGEGYRRSASCPLMAPLKVRTKGPLRAGHPHLPQ